MSEVVEHLDLRTGRFRPLLIWKIAWTVTQATYRERFSPMAVAEVCCLYWLFLLRGYICQQIGSVSAGNALDDALRTRSQLASARRPRRGMPVTHDVLKIAIAQPAKQTAARDFGASVMKPPNARRDAAQNHGVCPCWR